MALEEEFFCLDPEEPPATAPELWRELGERSGLALEGSGLVPDTPVSLSWDACGGSGRTLRSLAAHIALLSGANAVIGRGGALRLLRFQASEAAVGPERYYESGLTVEEGDFVFGALEVTVPGGSVEAGTGEEDAVVYTRQLEGVSQGLAYTGADYTQAVFDRVWEAWQGRAFRPASVKFLGNPLLDVGDVIAVTDRAGTVYTVPVMSLRHSFDGGFTTTVTACAPAGTGAAAPQTATQVIQGLKTELGRFKRLYADNLSATNAALAHLTTEDIQGENGTINLAKGTFCYGDVLSWDGENLMLRGEINATSGAIGGWSIVQNAFGRYELVSDQGTYEMRLDPGDGEVGPCIYFDAGDSRALIEAYLYETSPGIQYLRLQNGTNMLNIGQNEVLMNKGLSVTGTITTPRTSNTYLNGNQGGAIINSTAAAGAYTMLAKLNSTNGYFCLGVYNDRLALYYTSKSVVDAGTNTITKSAVLLNEAGNTSFPGVVYSNGSAALTMADFLFATTKTVTMGTVAAGATASASFTIPSGYYVISSVVYQSSGIGFVVKTDAFDAGTSKYTVWLRADNALTNAVYKVNILLAKTNILPMQNL